MKSYLSFSFVLLTLLFYSLNLSAFEVETGVGISQISPSGNLSYKGIGLDVKNDLKYDKVSNFTGRIRLDLPLFLPNLYIAATPLKFDATGSKTVPFQFGNLSFSANVPFTSTLKLDHYDLTLFYGIPFIETVTDEKLRIDVGLNVRLIDFKAEINQAQTGLNESKSLAVPVPMGFLALQLKPIEKLSVGAEIKAIAYGKSRYYDANALVKYRILKFLFIGAGYKVQNITMNQNDVHTELEFSGPAAEVGIIF
ncbi:MAG: TIGR04219 family outer membrane beta-barrel protein [Elusimicrobia bacterium]|nr:TIGR04219 family outer membrane beta-barrel protein [Elusimicrobiota bacterium]